VPAKPSSLTSHFVLWPNVACHTSLNILTLSHLQVLSFGLFLLLGVAFPVWSVHLISQLISYTKPLLTPAWLQSPSLASFLYCLLATGSRGVYCHGVTASSCRLFPMMR
jgi:hypothetical protein